MGGQHRPPSQGSLPEGSATTNGVFLLRAHAGAICDRPPRCGSLAAMLMCKVCSFRLGEKNQKPTDRSPAGGPLMLSCSGSGPGPPHPPWGLRVFALNSALSFIQQKLSELCASLELQAAASATGGAAFRSPRGRAITFWSSCRLGVPFARLRVTLCTKECRPLYITKPLPRVAAHPLCAVTPADMARAGLPRMGVQRVNDASAASSGCSELSESTETSNRAAARVRRLRLRIEGPSGGDSKGAAPL